MASNADSQKYTCFTSSGFPRERFAATMKHQDAPGTTFKRHMKIARGLLSEDDYLLTEILFNPRTPRQIERIQEELHILQEIIKDKDSEKMKEYLTKIRKNIE